MSLYDFVDTVRGEEGRASSLEYDAGLLKRRLADLADRYEEELADTDCQVAALEYALQKLFRRATEAGVVTAEEVRSACGVAGFCPITADPFALKDIPALVEPGEEVGRGDD
jgi:hypothetical protein